MLLCEPMTRCSETVTYQKIESCNLIAKKLADFFIAILIFLAKIADKVLTVSEVLSLVLNILAGLLYAVGIVFSMAYSMYQLHYQDTNGNLRHTTLQAECVNIDRILNMPSVCDYYGFECTTNTLLGTATLTYLQPKFFVAVENFRIISWGCWILLRLAMRDTKKLYWEYALYFILQNAISYNFRHLGYLHWGNCPVLYSAYYTQELINNVWTFDVSLVIWFLLVNISLKRVRTIHLILRRCGEYLNVPDIYSVIANVFIFLFVAYAMIGSAIWVAVTNLVNDVQVSTKTHSYSVNWFEYFFTTLETYFVPGIFWYAPFTMASLLSNIVTLLDICIFFFQDDKTNMFKIIRSKLIIVLHVRVVFDCCLCLYIFTIMF